MIGRSRGLASSSAQPRVLAARYGASAEEETSDFKRVRAVRTVASRAASYRDQLPWASS